jgi:hypothetical protein
MSPTITPQELVAKWRGETRKERSVSQEHFIDLCRLLGHKTPGENRDGSLAFEEGANKSKGGQGWAGRDGPAPATYTSAWPSSAPSICMFAHKRGLINGENLISMIDRRTVHEYANAQRIEPAHLKQQVQAINRATLDGARDYALLAILSQTGRRLAEVASLRWAASASMASVSPCTFGAPKVAR